MWASLLPILGGVALATTSELTLAWAALFGAVISDVALALRNIYCKVASHTRGRKPSHIAEHLLQGTDADAHEGRRQPLTY